MNCRNFALARGASGKPARLVFLIHGELPAPGPKEKPAETGKKVPNVSDDAAYRNAIRTRAQKLIASKDISEEDRAKVKAAYEKIRSESGGKAKEKEYQALAAQLAGILDAIKPPKGKSVDEYWAKKGEKTETGKKAAEMKKAEEEKAKEKASKDKGSVDALEKNNLDAAKKDFLGIWGKIINKGGDQLFKNQHERLRADIKAQAPTLKANDIKAATAELQKLDAYIDTARSTYKKILDGACKEYNKPNRTPKDDSNSVAILVRDYMGDKGSFLALGNPYGVENLSMSKVFQDFHTNFSATERGSNFYNVTVTYNGDTAQVVVSEINDKKPAGDVVAAIPKGKGSGYKGGGGASGGGGSSGSY